MPTIHGQVMEHVRLAKTIGRCVLLSLNAIIIQTVFVAQAVLADGSHRIPRPTEAAAAKSTAATDTAATATETTAAPPPTTSATTAPATPTVTSAAKAVPTADRLASPNGTEPLPAKTLKAKASVDLDDQIAPPYQYTVRNWQTKNLLEQKGTVDNTRHKGLKAHVGGTLSLVGNAVGTVASAYVPIASVGLKSAPPKIEIEPGHCPASFDPAFQVPVKWWDTLSSEESDRRMGPQWDMWLGAVRDVFQSHAQELHDTPGVASLHVIVNPDGSLHDIAPYRGAERGNPTHAINARTMANLRQIISSVGRFPPFPAGSQVHAYHLIFNGSSGI